MEDLATNLSKNNLGLCNINQKQRNCLITHHVLCGAKEKHPWGNVFYDVIHFFWDEVREWRKGKLIRHEPSHKNLLTSLKFLQLFLFTFFLLFFMMIPDDWGNNIPCILSRLLNFWVEAMLDALPSTVGIDSCLCCVNVHAGDRTKRTRKKGWNFSTRTKRKKESF